MGKYIGTVLHNALEAAPDEPLLTVMSKLPHYVIDHRLIEMLVRDDVQRAINALIEAKIVQLPFPDILVEFEQNNKTRRFVRLKEDGDAFQASVVTFNRTRDKDVLLIPATDHHATLRLDTGGFDIVCTTDRGDALSAAFACCVSLLMLNTKGIDKVVIEPKALNKKREQHGKPVIPKHYVVRVGTVYDRQGREIPAHLARHMPLHWRAAHVRTQHFGRGNAETKLIKIPATLVNYQPGDSTSVPVRRKVLTA